MMRWLSCLIAFLSVSPLMFAGNVVQCGSKTSCAASSSCTVSFSSAVTPHDSIVVAAFTDSSNLTEAFSSITGDGTFTFAPSHTYSSSGSVTLAGLQNATGGETGLTGTLTTGPTNGWTLMGCEITPSVLEATGNLCVASNASSSTPNDCSVTIQASSRMENIVECIRVAGSATNVTNLAGYILVFSNAGTACAYLSTTSNAVVQWALSGSATSSVQAWSLSDTGGVTIR